MPEVRMDVCNATDLRKMKRLDKRRYEEVEKITVLIKTKEEYLSSLRAHLDPEQLQGKIKALRLEKEVVIAQRRRIDEQLQSLNKEVTNKRGEVAKILSNLKYKKEDKIDAAIKRLEYQLQVHNFKVNEEKKIVQEIDSLKRSKRSLKEFNVQKDELDEMRKAQNSMRSERDALYRKVTEIKAQEEKCKKEVVDGNAEADALRQEIDQLYEHKRTLIVEFHKAQQLKDEQRRQMIKKKQEERISLQEGKHKDGECSIVVVEPYLEERQLCSTLLVYLQRFERVHPLSCTEVSTSVETVDSPGHMSEGHIPSTPQFEPCGMFISRKKEDLIEYSCKTRQRRLRKEKKRKQEKPVSHTLEIFEQFAKLNLQAPSTQPEILASIEQLKSKKKYYEHLSSHQVEDLSPDFPHYTLSDHAASRNNIDPCIYSISTDDRNTSIDNALTSYTSPPKTLNENSSIVCDHSSVMCFHSDIPGDTDTNCNSSIMENLTVNDASAIFDLCTSSAEIDSINYKASVENLMPSHCEKSTSISDPESENISKPNCRQRPANLELMPRDSDCVLCFQTNPSCKHSSFHPGDELVSEVGPFVNGH